LTVANSKRRNLGVCALALLGTVACGGVNTSDLFQRTEPAEDAGTSKGKSDGGSASTDAGFGFGGVSVEAGGADGGGAPSVEDAGADTAEEAETATSGPGSCALVCGTLAPDESCYCDSLCQGYGDCCSDFESFCAGALPPGTGCSSALCGTETPGVSATGTACYCDAVCSQYGDCCGNVAQICPS
jgi:hypothetical protein